MAEYARRRSLDFVSFDQGWTEEKETLSQDDVLSRALVVFNDEFGVDPGGDLPELSLVRIANRKSIIAFAHTASPVLMAATEGNLHDAWTIGGSEVAACTDRAGLLDFYILEPDQIIPTLVQAGLWPQDLPPTLELHKLDVTTADIKIEAQRIEQERADQNRKKNQINFAGKVFDSSSYGFSGEFARLAEEQFTSSDWKARSRVGQASLRILPEKDVSRGAGGGGERSTQVQLRPRTPEAVRSAMGLAGELLAYQYLRFKHRERFSERCWVSEYREHLYSEPGDPRHGYDFKVSTTETDWLYEVKATPGDACEFELTDNEYRTAASAAADKGRRYRIILVQRVFDVDRCRVLELPNPTSDLGRTKFRIIGRSSVRLQFEIG
jgi:hypothetical protein